MFWFKKKREPVTLRDISKLVTTWLLENNYSSSMTSENHHAEMIITKNRQIITGSKLPHLHASDLDALSILALANLLRKNLG